MEYKIRLHPRVRNQIAGWGLSDDLLVEIHLQLRETLGVHPVAHLQHDRGESGNANLFTYGLRDPADPNFQLIFQFRVYYDEDEVFLNIVNASYWRNFDPLWRPPT